MEEEKGQQKQENANDMGVIPGRKRQWKLGRAKENGGSFEYRRKLLGRAKENGG